MKLKTSCFLTLVLATVSQTAMGATVISQAGFPVYGWSVRTNEYHAVAWSQAASYRGMDIHALLWSPAPGDRGTAWLTTRIGPGTALADQVATATFTFPSSIGPWTVPSVRLFTGLTLPAGTYYLTIGGATNLYSSWPGANQATVTTATGVTLDGNLWAAPYTDPYPPASQFRLGSGMEHIFSITGNIILAPSPPVVICPEPLTLESTNSSAVGTVQVAVMDTNGLPLEVIWTVDGTAYQTNDIPSGGSVTASNVTFTASFGEGAHTVVVTASNGLTTPASCSTTVTVADTLPPTVLEVSVTPSSLWPPNHRMVPVSVVVEAADNSGASPVSHIAHVISNESQNPFAPDWEITGPLRVNLRAERAGSRSGRIYTVVVVCEDRSGNVAYASIDVDVDHDQR